MKSDVPNVDTQLFQRIVLQQAASNGAIVVEAATCPHCQHFQFVAHVWTETVDCQNAGCGRSFPSKVARRPVDGELNAEHYRLAMFALHGTYVAQQAVELPAVSREEVAALPAEMQLILARQSVAASKHVLEKASALAQEMAKLDE